MKEKTKTASKSKAKTLTVKPELITGQLNRDVRDAVLVVSVIVNAYVFVGWLVLQVTTQFDASLITYLQNR